jgi:hypothetical protein
MSESFLAEHYMIFATPISASCVKDGIPMLPLFKGNTIQSWFCGHCGLTVSIDNKKMRDMYRND